MSTLAVVLAAALAVPGSGPERMSAETEQRLDLRGRWEGSWLDDGGNVWETKRQGGMLAGHFSGVTMWLDLSEVVDEGGGRFRMDWGGIDYLGIYKQEGDSLTLCYRKHQFGYPPSFRGGRNYFLLTLHRARPRK